MSGTRALRSRTISTAVPTTGPLRRPVRLAALLTALAVLAAPAAHAESWTHDDASHDVLVTDYHGDPDTVSVVDPDEDLADITRLTVDVTSDRVQVALSLRYGSDGDTTFKIETSKGDTFHVLRSGRGKPYLRRNSYKFTCPSVSLVPTRAGLLLRFPQSCLGSVYRVRVGAQASAYAFGNESDTYVERIAQDDAYRTGKYTHRSPRLGPWVAASRAS